MKTGSSKTVGDSGSGSALGIDRSGKGLKTGSIKTSGSGAGFIDFSGIGMKIGSIKIGSGSGFAG